jgi:tetratricopeptide (TPR) repeat protein
LVRHPANGSCTKASPGAAYTADRLIETGFLLSRERRWDDAIVRYREAITLEPANKKALRNLGYALNRIGRFEEAEFHLSRGIVLDSSFGPTKRPFFTNAPRAVQAEEVPAGARGRGSGCRPRPLFG